MKMLCKVKLSEHKYKTPEGYLYCKDAIIARTGKQTYLESEIYEGSTSDDYVEVDRSEKEVFSPETLASFENKPLTIEHPNTSVGPENYKNLSVGHVQNVRKGEYEGQPVMLADIVVNDAEAINLIESGEMTELSCGYDCDITEGPNPEQINIRGNHVALCEAGRAGIAMIVDSKPWGVKSIQDSVSKGALIQEFGKQGKQYKISKIVGNVLYCESLETGKTILFKKDEENIEWALITKSEVKDSKINDANLRVSKLKVGQIVHLDPETTSLVENKELLDDDYKVLGFWYKDNVIEEDVAPENIMDLSGIRIENVRTGKRYNVNRYQLMDSKTKDLNEYYTIDLKLCSLYRSVLDGVIARDHFCWEENPYRDNKYKTLEEAVKDAKALFEEYKNKTKISDKEYEYYTVGIIHWIDQGGTNVDENDKDLGIFPVYSAYNREELPEKIKEKLGYRDSALQQFVIKLDDGSYLDINDKPIADKNAARKFNSKEEAEAHCDTYCKGCVCDLVEDSEVNEYKGYDLLRGEATKDFKQYLRDRGLYFEPSSNGDFIHFEVKNADEDVDKQVEAIRRHYASLEDGYSKKFYSKMVKELEKQLEDLDKKETLDENQHSYERQKNRMRESLQKQIEEYKSKLNE